MTALIAPTEPPATRRPGRILLSLLLISAAVTAAAAAGIFFMEGSKAGIVIPVALVGGTALCFLAVSRFEAFVLIVLVLRSSMDIAKLPGESGSGAASPAGALALLFLVGAGLWMVARRTAGLRHPKSPLQTAVLLVLATGVLSIPLSLHPMAGILELLRIASGCMMFFVVDRIVTDNQSARRVLIALFGSAIIPLAVTAYGVASGGAFVEYKDQIARATSTFAQSNPFAGYLLILSLMAIGLLPHVRRRPRVVLSVLLLCMLVALMLTYTRGAWIGLVIGILVIGSFDNRKLIGGLLLGGLVVLLLVPSVTGRFTELTRENPYPDERDNSLMWRFSYWGEVLPLANQNPITGIGLKSTIYLTEKSKLPHNDYLRSYVETGIIGLAAYVFFVITMVRTGWRAARQNPRGIRRGIGIGFVGYAVAFLIVSMVENLSSQVVILWYLFAFAGLANWATRSTEQSSEVGGPVREELPASTR